MEYRLLVKSAAAAEGGHIFTGVSLDYKFPVDPPFRRRFASSLLAPRLPRFVFGFVSRFVVQLIRDGRAYIRSSRQLELGHRLIDAALFTLYRIRRFFRCPPLHLATQGVPAARQRAEHIDSDVATPLIMDSGRGEPLIHEAFRRPRFEHRLIVFSFATASTRAWDAVISGEDESDARTSLSRQPLAATGHRFVCSTNV